MIFKFPSNICSLVSVLHIVDFFFAMGERKKDNPLPSLVVKAPMSGDSKQVSIGSKYDPFKTPIPYIRLYWKHEPVSAELFRDIQLLISEVIKAGGVHDDDVDGSLRLGPRTDWSLDFAFARNSPDSKRAAISTGCFCESCAGIEASALAWLSSIPLRLQSRQPLTSEQMQLQFSVDLDEMVYRVQVQDIKCWWRTYQLLRDTHMPPPPQHVLGAFAAQLLKSAVTYKPEEWWQRHAAPDPARGVMHLPGSAEERQMCALEMVRFEIERGPIQDVLHGTLLRSPDLVLFYKLICGAAREAQSCLSKAMDQQQNDGWIPVLDEANVTETPEAVQIHLVIGWRHPRKLSDAPKTISIHGQQMRDTTPSPAAVVASAKQQQQASHAMTRQEYMDHVSHVSNDLIQAGRDFRAMMEPSQWLVSKHDDVSKKS